MKNKQWASLLLAGLLTLGATGCAGEKKATVSVAPLDEQTPAPQTAAASSYLQTASAEQLAALETALSIAEEAIQLSADPVLTPAEGCQAWYVSEASGSDRADGKTPETAWKTLDRVILKSKKTIQSGDVVFFERGGVYRNTGDYALPAISGVTYAAYGEGAKPVLTAAMSDAADASLWKETDVPGIWKIVEGVDRFDIGSIVFNGGEFLGEKAVMEYELLDNNTPVFNAVGSTALSSYRDLTRERQFLYVNGETTFSLYLYSAAGNPGEVYDSISFCRKIDVMAGQKLEGVVLDNLAFAYGSAQGVSFDACRNCTVRNCCFSYIGGGVDRYDAKIGDPWDVQSGNGVHLDSPAYGQVVENCLIHHVFGAGINVNAGNTQTALTLTFRGNVIRDCGQGIAMVGEGKTDVVTVTGNRIFRSSLSLPSSGAVTLGDDSGALGIHTEADGLVYTLTDNVIAYAAARLATLSSKESTYTLRGNTFVGTAENYVTVEGKLYRWDESGAAAVVLTAGEADAVCYLSVPEKETLSRGEALTVSASVKPGDLVTFGAYEQDADQENGAEPITWRVLEVQDGQALLLSEAVLDCRAFRVIDAPVNWARADLRRWLNGEFAATAFTAEEAAKLCDTKVEMEINSVRPSEDLLGDAGSVSKVFLLTEAQLRSYLTDLRAAPTARAAVGWDNTSHLPVVNGSAAYWLSNYGADSTLVSFVTCDGAVYGYGAPMNGYSDCGVRPAIRVTIG